MGLAPPSACRLTAADSFDSLFPIYEFEIQRLKTNRVPISKPPATQPSK